MVFTDLKMLIPANKSKDRLDLFDVPPEVGNMLETDGAQIEKRWMYDDRGDSPDSQIANSRRIEDIADELPNNDEEILRCLDSTVLEDQPTEVLFKLAEKLKERRAQLYPEEVQA